MAPPKRSSSAALPDLLREAGAAARAGDLSEAERLYRRVLDRSPANVEAWMGLGTVVQGAAEKAACFRQVLEIDPENQDAAASLARLQAVLPAEPEPLRCAFHPDTSTVLRCSQCGRPICVRCARPYPVGQLCPICVRDRRPLPYRPGMLHLAAVGAATAVAATLAGLLAAWVAPRGFALLLAILGGPSVGSVLAQVALWAGRRHRGPAVQITTAAAIAAGSIAGWTIVSPLPIELLTVHIGPFLSFGIYTFLAIGSALAWLR